MRQIIGLQRFESGPAGLTGRSVAEPGEIPGK